MPAFLLTETAFSLPLTIRSDGGVKVKSSTVGTAGSIVNDHCSNVKSE